MRSRLCPRPGRPVRRRGRGLRGRSSPVAKACPATPTGFGFDFGFAGGFGRPLGLPSPPSSDPPTPAGVQEDFPPFPRQRGGSLNPEAGRAGGRSRPLCARPVPGLPGLPCAPCFPSVPSVFPVGSMMVFFPQNPPSFPASSFFRDIVSPCLSPGHTPPFPPCSEAVACAFALLFFFPWR